MLKRIAIQGYEGSFHQEAAFKFFGKKIEIICCQSFKEVVEKASNADSCDYGVMAIENSIAGSILQNYNLLQKSELKVVGEIYLRIKQNLLVNKGVKIESIKEVHSHTMALQQCYDFLDRFHWKLVETDDTALSAKHISQHKSIHIAAIAGKFAAELFGLEILEPNIHTIKDNYTRFLIVKFSPQVIQIKGADKASVIFHTDHSIGSLAKVLAIIADEGVNLSKLQSAPLPGSTFMYSFHADMEFHSIEQLETLLARLTPEVLALKVYGIYKKANLGIKNE